MKLFGNTVKFLLAQRGLTAKELAERVNLSETSVSKIVNGVTNSTGALYCIFSCLRINASFDVGCSTTVTTGNNRLSVIIYCDLHSCFHCIFHPYHQ